MPTSISPRFTLYDYTLRHKNVWRITGDGNDHRRLIGGVTEDWLGAFVSWLGKLHQAQAEHVERADPFRQKIEAAVHGKEATSTAALLDLLGVPKTTGNARRIANTMRSLGFIPIKSRRLMPGGFRDTVARGWARPVRKTRNSTPIINPRPA
jgi:hypothetical protein